MAAALCLAGGASRAQDQPHQQPPTIRVHSDLVVLHVAVADRRADLLPGLARDHFKVYEDGELQQISFFTNEDSPVSVGLVVDNSTSMWGKSREVIAAGLAFTRSSNHEDELFTVNFNERARFGLPAGTPFTSDIGTLEKALATIRARGKTALYDALLLALSHIERGSQDKKVLIVVSDGGDNASAGTLEQVVAAAQRSNTVVYAVGIADQQYRGADWGILKRLAKITGGAAFFPDELEDVTSTLEHIAHDIRSGYTIGYVPSNTRRDGGYRTIRVVVEAPGRDKLTVRTRTGYLAPSDPSAAR